MASTVQLERGSYLVSERRAGGGEREPRPIPMLDATTSTSGERRSGYNGPAGAAGNCSGRTQYSPVAGALEGATQPYAGLSHSPRSPFRSPLPVSGAMGLAVPLVSFSRSQDLGAGWKHSLMSSTAPTKATQPRPRTTHADHHGPAEIDAFIYSPGYAFGVDQAHTGHRPAFRCGRARMGLRAHRGAGIVADTATPRPPCTS